MRNEEAGKSATLKGLLLSGGRGTRLFPITNKLTKQLIPVANKPVLLSALEDLVSSGITEIGVIISPERGEAVRDTVGDGHRFGAEVTYIVQEAPLGVAQTILAAKDFLQGSSFVLYLGDNLLELSIAKHVASFSSGESDALILSTPVPDPERYSVVQLDESAKAVRLSKASDPPISSQALVGVFMFRAAVYPVVEGLRMSARGELEITDTIQSLIDSGRNVEHHFLQGWWKDVGSLTDLLDANHLVLDTMEAKNEGELIGSEVRWRVVIGPGAVLQDSFVEGPAIIGDGAYLVDARVGPYTSIGEGCRIERAAVRNCVLLSGVTVTEETPLVEACLIGD